MRISTWSVVAAILLTVGFEHSAYAARCTTLHGNNATQLKLLYGYAQIAEAPKNHDLSYMENCETVGGSLIAESPTDIVDLIVPKEFTDLVVKSVEHMRDRARLQPTRLDQNGRLSPFTVGCSIEQNDENMLVNFSFKLLATIIGNRAVFYLTGTEVKGSIVLSDSGMPITIIPGTDLLQLPEIQANFKGEKCVFPLVRTTVDVLCKVLRYRKGPVYQALVEKNNNGVLSQASHSVTMIGHSLGGSATQYVASNIPDQCKPEGDFVAFEAYAFASPGLVEQGDAQRQSKSLGGYLINGDWLLQRAFSDRFQRGRVSVFTPPGPRMSCPGHFIDEVQESICLCLQGEGMLDFPKEGLHNAQMFTDQRCEMGSGRNSP